MDKLDGKSMNIVNENTKHLKWNLKYFIDSKLIIPNWYS